MIGAKPRAPRSQRIGEAVADALLFVPRIVHSAIHAIHASQSEPDTESAQLRTIIRGHAARIKLLEDALTGELGRATKAVAGATTRKDANIVSWVAEFEARHGRKPKIPEVQAEFPAIARTTVWRRIRDA